MADPSHRRTLAQLPLFEGLPDAVLDGITRSVESRRVRSGTLLCRAGEPGDALFIITDGTVHVVSPLPSEQDVVAELGTGAWFGEMALITGEPRSATVCAVTDVQVLVLSRGSFLRVWRIVTSPNLARIAVRTLEVASRERVLANLALADVAIHSDVGSFSSLDYASGPEIVAAGVEAAEAALPMVRKVVSGRETSYAG